MNANAVFRGRVFRAFFGPLLALLSMLYSNLMRLRSWFYLVGILPSESSGSFVVSIGNIQVGGTGKTPVVSFFARRWRTHLRLGIVSRGYGRKTTGSFRVEIASSDAKFSAAEKFGDEPLWLAQSLASGNGPAVPVQVGEKRIDAARDLIAAEGVKLILLDDGFQHLAIRRSFDIVLIDASVEDWHWHVLPWGRLREPLSALRRADAIIFTKTESVSSERLERIEKRMSRWAGVDRRTLKGAAAILPVLRFRQSISWPEPIAGEPLILAAGLARPEAFFELVKSHESKPRLAETVSFADHHEYTLKDVAMLRALAQKHRIRRVMVTEKDAVKLQPMWTGSRDVKLIGQSDVKLIVSTLEVRPARESDEKQLERLDETILDEVRGVSRTGARISDSQPPT